MGNIEADAKIGHVSDGLRFEAAQFRFQIEERTPFRREEVGEEDAVFAFVVGRF